MNILKSMYSNYWKAGEHEFKLVNHEEEYVLHSNTIEGICEILAYRLNWDCEKFADFIGEFTRNYIVVDEDKNILTIEYRYDINDNDVRIVLVTRTGKVAVTFDMSEYIDADERYY